MCKKQRYRTTIMGKENIDPNANYRAKTWGGNSRTPTPPANERCKAIVLGSRRQCRKPRFTYTHKHTGQKRRSTWCWWHMQKCRKLNTAINNLKKQRKNRPVPKANPVKMKSPHYRKYIRERTFLAKEELTLREKRMLCYYAGDKGHQQWRKKMRDVIKHNLMLLRK